MVSAKKWPDPIGHLPALQYLLPQQLQIDDAYQRSIETGESQGLIRKIAGAWNWDLCQPLVVARRPDGALYVIDGQHRLAAARLRGDIQQLPAVVVQSSGATEEAKSFVYLNQQRQPLNRLQLFRAAVASGDEEARAIMAAIEASGLRLGKSKQLISSPAGTINHIGGIQQAWHRWGSAATAAALEVLAMAFTGQQLTYAGTIWPGIVAVASDEIKSRGALLPTRAALLAAMLGSRSQSDWRGDMLRLRIEDGALHITGAAVAVIRAAWDKHAGQPARPAPAPVERAPAKAVRQPAPTAFNLEGGKAWCDQCEQRRDRVQAHGCTDRFCKLKAAA